MDKTARIRPLWRGVRCSTGVGARAPLVEHRIRLAPAGSLLLPGTSVICYADDTLLVARGGNFGEAACLASAGGSLVAGRIRRLGLRVALNKTEAVFFHGPRQRRPSRRPLRRGGRPDRGRGPDEVSGPRARQQVALRPALQRAVDAPAESRGRPLMAPPKPGRAPRTDAGASMPAS